MGDASQQSAVGGRLALQAGSEVGSGRFILMKELGRGGMGVVWLAEDTNLGEQVALKFLPPEVAADPVALNDLRRETVRSHRLTHPNIIRIHDFHQQPDGIAFISMEYVDGMTLSGWRLQQANQVFTWEQLAPLVQQLCAALEYAHGEGVIHRDLKPANVMLDSKGRVKLADFGIAAVVSDSVSRVSVRSSTGGTLAYMSPQQIRGQTPTVADDVYALGASVYELLTGRPPFYRGDITHQALNEPAAPLADRVLELGVDNPVPDPVGALVMACLAKEPERRPTSARAVAEWIRFETVTPDLAVTAAAGSAPVKSGAQWGLWLGVGSAAVLLFVCILWFGIAGKGKPQREANSANRGQGSSGGVSASAAEKGHYWTNSLGMVFVPVPGTKVDFCIWETRVRDFEAFVTATAFPTGNRMFGHRKDGWRERAGEGWRNPGFAQTSDHPVVGVNWSEAEAFCEWLTKREKLAGTLDPASEYRLPSDADWSAAVGQTRYPWGDGWPPPAGAGNYSSEETLDGNMPKGMPVIAGYRDHYARTCPVGSFNPNTYGLYDMGGNVWEWCRDWYSKDKNDPSVLAAFPTLKADGGGQLYRIYRGGGWNDAHPMVLLSANRMGDGFAYPDKRYDNTGFRVVLDKAPAPESAGRQGAPDWKVLGYGLYLHFDISTFGGYAGAKDLGRVPAERFAPPATMDVRAWVQTAKEAGMTFAVLTAKHEAGFCLWPAKDYDYSVATGSLKRDIVGEFVAACETEGILPGLHYSIPDAHNEGAVQFKGPVGAPYFNIIKKQITELHTQYPGIRAQVFDGQTRLSRSQFQDLCEIVRRLSPQCVILGAPANQGGPEFHSGPTVNLLTTSYNAASVNKGWIWSANAALTPTQELFRLYQQSRGKGWPFLLNVGPDQTGRIPEPCAGVLMQMKKLIGGEAAASRGFYASLRSVTGIKALIENSPQP